MTRHAAYPDWSGQTVAILCSGPSLTQEQCEVVRQAGCETIAVCSSWKMARFCDVIYASDEKWWKFYGGEIDIDAERWTCIAYTAENHGLKLHGPYPGVSNSGSRALEFAIECRPKKIILLGADCHVRNGTHHHGDHPRTKNPDATRCRMWLAHYAKVDCRGIEVVNCSPDSDLECFPKAHLSEVL